MASNGAANGANPLDNDAANSRAAVHAFDPDASPEEKASSAGKARDKLAPVNATEKATEREVQIDQGGGGVVPTITLTDADKEHPDESSPEADGNAAPGGIPTSTSAIPDWYTVGWRQTARIDEPEATEGEERDLTALGMFVSEQYYGAWYHNAAIIIFAVFASHFLTRFGFGWGWLFVLLAVCNTYYSTSMTRVRRHARDDIQRELVKTRLASEHETADWINNFLDRFWLIYEPVLSTTIVSSVDQILSSNTPPFLDSIRLSQFTLGTKAPRIDKVRTFPKTADDIIMMDWGISFTPNDTSEMTFKQAQQKVNPKIVLSIRVGKGLATAAMPILLEDITFSGLMRIKLKLMSNFPHVQIVDFCFLEKPVIDYVLKPIGGETFGFDIASIPGLSSFIRDMTHATLGPMMYDPNVFTLNLEQMLSGTPLDYSIGVLQITVHTARGIKGNKIGGGTPDPFVGISFNGRAEMARTKYKNSTYNPTWTETKFVLVLSLGETIVFNVWDYNDHRKDTHLGSANFDLISLQEDASQEGIISPILLDGKDRGELKYDISFYPVLKGEGDQPPPETSAGIVRLTVHQAKELDAGSFLTGDLNPLAKVYLGANKTAAHTTITTKHTNSPIWESAYEFLCADRNSSVITINVVDDRDFLKDPVIGVVSITLQDLLECKKKARDWFPLSNCKTGRIRMSAEWKPLDMAGSLHGADQYTPPIGVVRLLLDKATDVKNVEATLGGKSDPYVRVQINNETKVRTEVINNNLNPVWDQIVYVPVHSLKQSLFLECMDYQHLTKDRSLGSVEVHLSDLAEESDDPTYPYESKGKKSATDPLKQDRGHSYKGNLHYIAEFIPAMKLQGIQFEKQTSDLQAAPDTDDEGGDAASSASSSSEDLHLPSAPTFRLEKEKHHHHKRGKSTDTTHTANTTNTAETAETTGSVGTTGADGDEDPGVSLSDEELLTHQSGIIICNVISGELSKKARLEVLLDDAYWPAFSTNKARSTTANWQQVGEGFVKELDFSQVWLRLNEADEGDKDDVICQWKGDTKAFLQSTLNGPSSFTLNEVEDPDKASATVTVEARYVPVPVTLEARESVNNQGVLRLDLISGHDILAADRGGKSDPYAVLSLNGQKIFKSSTKKKTLNPEWNENVTIQVPSRVGAEFEVEVFDWNQIEQAKSLGRASINLENIEPFQAAERDLHLTTKHGQKGHIKVRLMFQPEIIAKSRKNTSTFSTAGRAMTQFGGLPVHAGKGVLQGVKGLFSRDDEDETLAPPEIPSGQASHNVGGPGLSEGAAFEHGTSNSSGEPGTLRVTILDAKDLSSDEIKPYVTTRVADKEQKTKHTSKTATPEWNETFTFAASVHTTKLYVWVHDHKTLGKDKLLGAGEADIWRHIKPQGQSAAEVLIELQEGQGLLKLRLEFDAKLTPPGRASSIASSSPPIGSPSRFSLSRRRVTSDNDSD